MNLFPVQVFENSASKKKHTKIKQKTRTKKYKIKFDQRYSPLYQQWRISVYKRDCYTCQYCGKKHGKMNAHHIKGYAKYPHLRLDISNGITLCSYCHWKFHNKFGKQNFPDIRILIQQKRNNKENKKNSRLECRTLILIK